MNDEGVLQKRAVDEYELDGDQCVARLNVVRHFCVTIDVGIEERGVGTAFFVTRDEPFFVHVPEFAHAVPRCLIVVEVLAVGIESSRDLMLQMLFGVVSVQQEVQRLTQTRVMCRKHVVSRVRTSSSGLGRSRRMNVIESASSCSPMLFTTAFSVARSGLKLI